MNPSTSANTTLDLNAILRALLAKQGQHIGTVEKKLDHPSENTLSSQTTPVITSQIPSDPSS
jgi:hypothetical protein